MKQIILIISCWMLWPAVSSAQLLQGQLQSPVIPAPVQHYQNEYTFDISSAPDRWKQEPAGLNVSFATTDALYFRSDVPDLDSRSLSYETTAWKGERVNVLILVWSPDTLEQVRVSLNDLKNSTGKVISAANIHAN